MKGLRILLGAGGFLALTALASGATPACQAQRCAYDYVKKTYYCENSSEDVWCTVTEQGKVCTEGRCDSPGGSGGSKTPGPASDLSFCPFGEDNPLDPMGSRCDDGDEGPCLLCRS